MTRISTLTLAAFLLALCPTADAALVIYEPFDYTATTGDNTQDLSGRNGGMGFDGAWTVGGNVNATPSSNGHFQVAAPGMTFPGLPVAGNFAGRTVHQGNIGFANRPISAGAQSMLTASNSTTWFSLLIRPTNNNPADFNFSFADQPITTTNSAVLAAAGNGFGIDVQNNVLRGISWEGSTTRSSSAASLGLTGGTTYLIAGEIIWAPGTTGHELKLYNIADPMAAPPAPFATITADFNQSGIDTLGIRDRVPNSNVFGVDEIRFATTFEEAMGMMAVVPEPASLTLLAMSLVGLAVYGWRRK